MATKIKHLKDEEGKFYPYTHESAIICDDGGKLSEKVTQLDQKVSEVYDAYESGELKGADGQQGPAGPKGDTGATGPQGNSGYTGAAGELEVVNNVYDGGATAAFSAEMGKTLNEKTEELYREFLPIEDWKVIYWGIGNDNKWSNVNLRSLIIPVNGGDSVTVGHPNRYMFIAALTDIKEPRTGASVSFSAESGWTSRISCPIGVKSYTMPSDAKYLYLLVYAGPAAIFTPNTLIINGHDYSHSYLDYMSRLETAEIDIKGKLGDEFIESFPYRTTAAATQGKEEKVVTITANDENGRWGWYNISGSGIDFVIENEPASDTTVVGRMIRVNCEGFNTLYIDESYDMYRNGVFYDKYGNIIENGLSDNLQLKWCRINSSHGALQSDGTYMMCIPEGAVYADICFYGTKAQREAYKVKMVKNKALNTKEMLEHKMYKVNSSNGLNNIFQTNGEFNFVVKNERNAIIKSNLIPVELGDEFTIKGEFFSFLVNIFDKHKECIFENIIVKDYEKNGDLNVKKIHVTSEDFAYFSFTFTAAFKTYGHIGLPNVEMTITNKEISKSEFYAKDLSFWKLSVATEYNSTPLVPVKHDDLISYHILGNYDTGSEVGRIAGLWYYDANKKFICCGKTIKETGIAKEYPPYNAAFVRYAYNSAGTEAYMSINAVSTESTLGRLITQADNTAPFDVKILNEKSYEEVIYIDGVRYYADVSNNISCCITNNERYIVGGDVVLRDSNKTQRGRALFYRYSDNKGKSWSKIKIAFNTIAWDLEEGNTGDNTHSVSATTMFTNKNGRVFAMFGTNDSPVVVKQLGALSNGTKKRMLYIYSDNDGDTWSDPVDITEIFIEKFGVIDNMYFTLGRGISKNGTILLTTYYMYTSTIKNKGCLVYSVDDGETWHCSDIIDGWANETAICEVQDNLFLILQRATEGVSNKKMVWTLNVANKLNHENWKYEQWTELSDARLFDEASGYGQEGETAGIGRIRLNDHYCYLYGMQTDDTRNVSLLASHDLKKMIPIHHLITPPTPNRLYTLMYVYKDNILLATRAQLNDMFEVRAYICNGLVNKLESVGKVDDVKVAVDPVTFDDSELSTDTASKLNTLVSLMQSNGYMKDWRNYTRKLGYSCESAPAAQYLDFTTPATNRGIMYARHIIEGPFKMKVVLPEQNFASGVTSVDFNTCFSSGASNFTRQLTVTKREGGKIYAEFSSNGMPYSELLFINFYNGVSQSQITTDGIEVYIYE